MASIWKHPKSKYYTACFTDKEGKRHKRSTKSTDKDIALSIAKCLEDAARGNASKDRILSNLSDILDKLEGGK